MRYICSNCVMDTSDLEIIFDEDGVCNHCIDFKENISKYWFPNEKGTRKWSKLVSQIKQNGRDKDYDCILGLSGGVDSSYLAIKLLEYDLRPLVIHVDTGWNSELSVSNIERIVKHCKYDLITHVVNWNEMRDLQLSYLKSGIANLDIPQDHIIFATIYHFAVKHDIKYVISGGNIATESIFPAHWLSSAMDSKNLKSIQKKFGTIPLKNYKTINFFSYYFWYPFYKQMRTIRPLNYMKYIKNNATTELEKLINFKPYNTKHGENFFTHFFQNFYLPTKFGYDKRRPHFSSLILSGQLSRKKALLLLEEPLFKKNDLENDFEYFCKKMKISRKDFDQLLVTPIVDYRAFSNWNKYYYITKKIQKMIELILNKPFRFYS